MNQLVLSLFPGLDLFGKGFEAEGFCVVRGPDPMTRADGYGRLPPTKIPPAQARSRCVFSRRGVTARVCRWAGLGR